MYKALFNHFLLGLIFLLGIVVMLGTATLFGYFLIFIWKFLIIRWIIYILIGLSIIAAVGYGLTCPESSYYDKD